MKKSWLGMTLLSVIGTNAIPQMNVSFRTQLMANDDYYDKTLPWGFFSQDGPNHCAIASMQEFIYYYTDVKIEQEVIAKKANWNAKDGTSKWKIVPTLDYFLDNKKPNLPFYFNPLRNNFGTGSPETKLQEMTLFQNYVKNALEHDHPIMLCETKDVGHAVNLIGIEILNNDPAKTIYTISDSKIGKEEYFEGEDLPNLFPRGGELISVYKFFEPFSLVLNVQIQKEELRKYRESAAIKSVFNFYNTGDDITSEAIYNDFSDPNSKYGELIINDRLANYMQWFTNKPYVYNPVREGYGIDIADRKQFQDYIINSIKEEIPVIFSYKQSLPPNESIRRHVVIISGIEVKDDNPNHTVYYVSDPDKKGTRWDFLGRNLKTFTEKNFQGLIGVGKLSDF